MIDRSFVILLASAILPAAAQEIPYNAQCAIPSATVQAIQGQLGVVVGLSDDNGGIFKPNLMWSAIVDRKGMLCSVIKTGDAWPGSRDIAIAKASTANDFSNHKLALSTANLYAPTQPGGSLWGLNNSNPFNPLYHLPISGVHEMPSGIITFGGGVALYDAEHRVIGGLGVSGDSSCADHAIAFRMRQLAGLNTTPGAANADNIIYGPTSASGFWQPHCFPQDLTPQQIIDIPAH